MNTSIRRNGIAWLVLCAMGAFALALSAQGASFDCTKAGTKVEKIICDNPKISKLDDELSKTYNDALEHRPIETLLPRHQRMWLKERNRCKDVLCILKAYQQRISEMNVSYTLAMSKDEKLCNAMLALYNEDMRAYGRIRYDQHEMFTHIQWQLDKELQIQHAFFDINNDGKNELVVKSNGRLHGIDIDEFYIYPEDSNVFAKLKPGAGGLHSLLNNPNRLFSGENNVYYLKASPKTSEFWVGVYFVLEPFIWEGTSYISMTDQTPRWIVIAKYKKAEETQDICYFFNSNIEHQR